MGTKRTPIRRQSEPRITPAAIRLFENMRRCRCTCVDDRKPGTLCNGCERWWRLHNDLVDELGTMPWQWPCVQNPNTQNLYIGWEPDREAQERWQALAAASRDAKRDARRTKVTP